MKDENVLLIPITFLTIIPASPEMRTGVTQFIVVLLTTLKDVAFVPPNVTSLAPVKDVPVIVILVPPTVPPYDCEILVITGGIR